MRQQCNRLAFVNYNRNGNSPTISREKKKTAAQGGLCSRHDNNLIKLFHKRRVIIFRVFFLLSFILKRELTIFLPKIHFKCQLPPTPQSNPGTYRHQEHIVVCSVFSSCMLSWLKRLQKCFETQITTYNSTGAGIDG